MKYVRINGSWGFITWTLFLFFPICLSTPVLMPKLLLFAKFSSFRTPVFNFFCYQSKFPDHKNKLDSAWTTRVSWILVGPSAPPAPLNQIGSPTFLTNKVLLQSSPDHTHFSLVFPSLPTDVLSALDWEMTGGFGSHKFRKCSVDSKTTEPPGKDVEAQYTW